MAVKCLEFGRLHIPGIHEGWKVLLCCPPFCMMFECQVVMQRRGLDIERRECSRTGTGRPRAYICNSKSNCLCTTASGAQPRHRLSSRRYEGVAALVIRSRWARGRRPGASGRWHDVFGRDLAFTGRPLRRRGAVSNPSLDGNMYCPLGGRNGAWFLRHQNSHTLPPKISVNLGSDSFTPKLQDHRHVKVHSF